MSIARFSPSSGLREGLACAALVFLLAAGVHAQDATAKSATTDGSVDFDVADAPPAIVELDLSQGMFRDLFGIGDAAVAGIADALNQASGNKPGAEGTRMAAEQLAAARQIVQLAGQLVQGVRVRVYPNIKEQSSQAEKLAASYDDKLRAKDWQTIVRARNPGNASEMVTVWVKRSAGAIKGVFVVAASREGIVLANVVCDVSPENVKKLTNAATNSALQAGLGQLIEAKMQRLRPPTPIPSKPGQN